MAYVGLMIFDNIHSGSLIAKKAKILQNPKKMYNKINL